MYADLKDYQPKVIEYCLEEAIKEKFPTELDFSTLEGVECNGVADVIKLVSKQFTATFPDNENVTRKLDEFEKLNIREEYCELEENEVPKRLENLQETLEKIKAMKKQAEEMYSSVLMEVAKYAAEVKRGTKEVRLNSAETFCIALAGYYLIYTWDKDKQKMVLAKAFPVPDRSEIWANEEKNREAMMNLFGLEFPEVERPEDTEEEPVDDLPFGAQE